MHAIAFVLLLLPIGIESHRGFKGKHKGRYGPVAPILTHAIAYFSGSIRGEVLFQQTYTQDYNADKLRITGRLHGLPPGAHGFHIHEYGDLRQGCMSAGAHYNPSGHNHGAPTALERHEGDLGNIVAGPDGTANINKTDHVLTIRGRQTIIGRALVIHEKEDDLGKGGDEESLKTGNAGGRLACAIIGQTTQTNR